MTVAPDPGEADPLIETIQLLAGRVTLAESIIRRLRIVIKVLGALVVAFFVMMIVTGLVAVDNRRQAHASEAETFARRVADCHSLDDVGSAIKAGVSVLPSDPRVTEFVANYDAAVDAAIVTAKTRKGYSADCAQIGAPPTQPGG